ncbi:hypothetical protein [Streptomyces nigrescens]|uniref:hypothetical protein n=1 Tax=Streptomyces nigrescens TaxID=1920 RepID=UPI00346A7DC7
MTASTIVAELTPAQITVTLDQWARPVVVLPDEVAARLAVSSRIGVKDYGYCHFESRRFDADTYETRAIRVMSEAVLAVNPDEQVLSQYERFGTGYFYGRDRRRIRLGLGRAHLERLRRHQAPARGRHPPASRRA